MLICLIFSPVLTCRCCLPRSCCKLMKYWLIIVCPRCLPRKFKIRVEAEGNDHITELANVLSSFNVLMSRGGEVQLCLMQGGHPTHRLKLKYMCQQQVSSDVLEQICDAIYTEKQRPRTLHPQLCLIAPIKGST
jgi:hypothetical protein